MVIRAEAGGIWPYAEGSDVGIASGVIVVVGSGPGFGPNLVVASGPGVDWKITLFVWVPSYAQFSPSRVRMLEDEKMTPLRV